MRQRILLVEDDSDMGVVLRDSLLSEGFIVDWCEDPQAMMKTIREFAPHLVLLDLTLPGNDDIEICHTLSNRRERLPIIILTARSELQDKVQGLVAGAADYVTKPFAFGELLARIHALLRWTAGQVESIRLGDTVVDFIRLRAYKGTTELSLTDREFELLRHFSERKGQVVTRGELLRLIWGCSDSASRIVDNCVARLRQKVERDPHHPDFIRTAYGGGYRLTIDS